MVLVWPHDPVGPPWRARIFVVCLLSLEGIAIAFIGWEQLKRAMFSARFFSFAFLFVVLRSSIRFQPSIRHVWFVHVRRLSI